MTNSNTLQALLYAHGGEMKKKDILDLLCIDAQLLVTLTEELIQHLDGQALEIFETQSTLSLRTGRSYVDDIEKLLLPDTEKNIGAAALEVLAIVLYKGSASRADIDYMRGVNSSGTLRQLVLRGLLDRTKDENGSRSWIYIATPELLAHIDVHAPSELPEYNVLHETLTTAKQSSSAS